ncbi:MAG: response regulator transcription factor [Gemmatimonadota bacterium]
MPESTELRILLLEDDPRDAELIEDSIRRWNSTLKLAVVNSAPAFSEALESFVPDVVLSDHAVGDFNAAAALEIVRARRPATAFVLVAGAFEKIAAQCLRAGAADLILKNDLSGLPAAIEGAVKIRAPLRKLSKRQLEVLQLLANGSSTREIAARLEVSVKTVETHRAQVMKRLNIRDLASLVRYAIRTGIVG